LEEHGPNGSASKRMRVSARPETDNNNRQARFGRRRPDGFASKETEHVIYVLEFKRVWDVSETYVAETKRVAELQQLAVTQGLTKIF
jgi:hypothetical protein